MNRKPRPSETKATEGHLAAFDQLPAETKELMKQKDQAEKASGKPRVEPIHKAQDKDKDRHG